jgi:hypothetical protein
MGGMRYIQKIFGGKPEQKEVGTGVRIMLKWILKQQGGRIWTAL